MSGHQRLLVRRLKGHTGSVNSVCVTPDNKHVVSSEDEIIRITQIRDGVSVILLSNE